MVDYNQMMCKQTNNQTNKQKRRKKETNVCFPMEWNVLVVRKFNVSLCCALLAHKWEFMEIHGHPQKDKRGDQFENRIFVFLIWKYFFLKKRRKKMDCFEQAGKKRSPRDQIKRIVLYDVLLHSIQKKKSL